MHSFSFFRWAFAGFYLLFGTGGVPPHPLSIGIIELGGKSRKIFEFKGLIRKIFRNKDLACQRALKMGLGQLRGPSWETEYLYTALSGLHYRARRAEGSVMVLTGCL